MNHYAKLTLIFLVLRITPKCRAKVCARWRMSLSPLTVLMRWCWCKSYFMLFGVGASCRILYSIASYLYVSCSGSITSVGEERAKKIYYLAVKSP